MGRLYAVPSLILFPGDRIVVSDTAQTEQFFASSWAQYDGVDAVANHVNVMAEAPGTVWADVTRHTTASPGSASAISSSAAATDLPMSNAAQRSWMTRTRPPEFDRQHAAHETRRVKESDPRARSNNPRCLCGLHVRLIIGLQPGTKATTTSPGDAVILIHPRPRSHAVGGSVRESITPSRRLCPLAATFRHLWL